MGTAASKSARRVMVAGATGNIGRAVCAAILERGGAVVALGRSESSMHAMLRRLPRAARARLHPILGDLTAPGVIESTAELALSQGPVDDLVVSMGPFEDSPVRALSRDQIERLVAVHAVAPVLLVKSLRASLARSRGAVVALSDEGLQRPFTNHAAYLAAKGALEGAMRALAADLAPRVRVNVLRPGIVSDLELPDPERKRRLAKRSLLERFGSADEVARVVVAMLDATWLSGQSWTVG